jgi:hypothetical protein
VGDYGAVAFGLASNTTTAAPVSGGAPSATVGPVTWDGPITAARGYNPFNQTTPPFTVNGVELGTGDYRSLTNFASVIDGLSNTAFIGEKAVRKDCLGSGVVATGTCPNCPCGDGCIYVAFGTTAAFAGTAATAPATGGNIQWNATMHNVSYFMRGMVVGNNAQASAPNPNQVVNTPTVLPRRPTQEDHRMRLGSWHPGISLFQLGDGSARSVSNAASTTVMQRFGSRNDRLTFDLP